MQRTRAFRFIPNQHWLSKQHTNQIFIGKGMKPAVRFNFAKAYPAPVVEMKQIVKDQGLISPIVFGILCSKPGICLVATSNADHDTINRVILHKVTRSYSRRCILRPLLYSSTISLHAHQAFD